MVELGAIIVGFSWFIFLISLGASVIKGLLWVFTESNEKMQHIKLGKLYGSAIIFFLIGLGIALSTKV